MLNFNDGKFNIFKIDNFMVPSNQVHYKFFIKMLQMTPFLSF